MGVKQQIPGRYWSEYLPQLARKGVDEAVSSVFFNSRPLNRWIRRTLSESGTPFSLLGDPVFEAVFPWKVCGKCFKDLVTEGIFCEDTIRAVDCKEKPAIRPSYPVYRHQWEAFKTLADRDRVNSVVVSSGTGSGKTECFMLPLLDDLAREVGQGKVKQGVRALFLYPLNALIESQRERLSNWTKHFGGRIRYCLYNGNTPERLSAADRYGLAPQLVADRKTLRENVPQMLLSNPSMIERMLLRDEDRPIIEKTKRAGCFRWVIIDEAHTYIGSKAADLALLLRRVMNAFGVSPEEVHFVATSATVDAGSEEACRNLKRFLQDISGASADQVHLILGERNYPPRRDAAWTSGHENPEELLETADREPELLKERLLASPLAMAIRNYFIVHHFARLSELKRHFGVKSDVEMLQWLDALTAVPDLLPLRLHQMLNALGGLYACPDPDCPDKSEELKDPEWRFGQVWPEGQRQCSCGAPLFPIAACPHCSGVLLKGEANAFFEVRPKSSLEAEEKSWNLFEDSGMADAESEIAQDVQDSDADEAAADPSEPLTDEVQETGDAEESDVFGDEGYDETESEFLDVLISNREASEDAMPGEVWWNTPQGSRSCSVSYTVIAGSKISCPECGAENSGYKYYVKRMSGAYIRGLMPGFIEHGLTDSPSETSLPMRGRRLISFEDSRRGTAKSAALIERDGERSMLASRLYLALLKKNAADPENQKQIDALRLAIEQVPAQKELFEKMLAGLLPKTEIGWNEFADLLRDEILQNGRYRHLVHAVWHQRLKNPEEARQLAEILILREFKDRSNSPNLENCGVVSLRYPALQEITSVPKEWPAGLTLDDWKNYLKLFVDLVIRYNHCEKFPATWQRLGGNRRIFNHSIRSPEAEKAKAGTKKLAKNVISWPQFKKDDIDDASRFVRYTAKVLSQCGDAAPSRVNRVLAAVFKALKERKILDTEGDNNYYLNFDKVVFALNREAWRFSNSRVFDVLVGNPESAVCPADPEVQGAEKIALPAPGISFDAWNTDEGETREKVRESLRADPNYRSAMEHGAWCPLATAALENQGYYSAAEHTAQLDEYTKSLYTEQFKDGLINVLSCSTTMEMGVDLADINTVVMNNVPPHPANYLQRTGRAGRRGETRASSFTLCRANPRDRAVFMKPEWALVGRQPNLQVMLDSRRLVQRHANAQLLSEFFISEGGGQLKIDRAAWLKPGEGEALSPAQRYSAWLEKTAKAMPADVLAHLRTVTRRSALQLALPEELVRQAKDGIEKLNDEWKRSLRQYNERIRELKNDNSAAAQALEHQKELFQGKLIYDALTADLYLPSTIFINRVTEFNNRTEQEEAWEKKHRRSHDNPSRDAAIGIYEYAPGTAVVIDSGVFDSQGIARSWDTPRTNADVGKIQEFKVFCRCKRCGEAFLFSAEKTAVCPKCKVPVPKVECHKALIPKGFLVGKQARVHNDLTRLSGYPRVEDVISMTETWRSVGRGLVKMRSSTEAAVISRNEGRDRKGFHVCLACGWAKPVFDEMEDDVRHRPVRTIPQDGLLPDGACPGSSSEHPFLMQRGVYLAADYKTDALEIGFERSSENWNDVPQEAISRHRSSAGLGLGIVLRRAIAEHYGIEEEEIGFVSKAVSDGIFVSLYDRTPAGYCSGIKAEEFPAIAEAARRFLDCPGNCADSCTQCIQTFDVRFKGYGLDRHDAMRVLNEELLASLTEKPTEEKEGKKPL